MIIETSSSVTGSCGSGSSDLIELYFSATWSCVVLRGMLHGILSEAKYSAQPSKILSPSYCVSLKIRLGIEGVDDLGAICFFTD